MAKPDLPRELFVDLVKPMLRSAAPGLSADRAASLAAFAFEQAHTERDREREAARERRLWEEEERFHQRREQRTRAAPDAATSELRPAHEVLGVSPRATAAEISTAYRQLARARHPDAGGSDAAMAELNTARDALLREAAHA